MSEFDFDSLISPIPRAEFFSAYWEMKPLRISRKQCGYYAPVVSGDDIDYMLSVACLLDRGGVELIGAPERSEEHTSELQSLAYLVCRLLLEKKKKQEAKNLIVTK